MDDDGTEPNHPPCETNNNKHHKCLTGKQMLQYTSINIEPFLKKVVPTPTERPGRSKR